MTEKKIWSIIELRLMSFITSLDTDKRISNFCQMCCLSTVHSKWKKPSRTPRGPLRSRS